MSGATVFWELPAVSPKAIPKKVVPIARVMMKGGILRKAMPKPFTKPAAMQLTSVTGTAQRSASFDPFVNGDHHSSDAHSHTDR